MAAPDLNEWWRQYSGDYEHRSWRDYRHLLAEAVRYGIAPPLLDVGCGYGFLVECARQFGIASVGLEASAHALAESSRRHPQADVRQWRAGDPLPFQDASIGIATLNQIVDHFSIDENRRLFADVWRVLKADGVLIVHSPSRFNRFDDDTGHVTFFSPSEFHAFVTSFGFRVIHQPYFPQPVLGHGAAGLAVRLLTRLWKVERLAATIDIVAVKS